MKRYLDVKKIFMENLHVMTKPARRDHVDRFLEEIATSLPELDLEVEGIVDRINGLNRRFKRSQEDTLAEFDLNLGEYHVLTSLFHTGPPYRRSPGWLADHHNLSSGAMTNRIDRLEEAGLVRRLPDPEDRRALKVELTEKGLRKWRESVGAQAVKEALIASALGDREKKVLSDLLRKLMVEFEQREGADPKFKRKKEEEKQ
jgi:DNA-binding MarR family transcriptional regulator